MGYREKALKTKCGNCGTIWGWKWREPEIKKTPAKLTCRSCGAENQLATLESVENVPSFLYLGHEKNRQLKILPVPVGSHLDRTAFPPYSIRSFVQQASCELGGCSYSCNKRGEVHGEYVFHDHCCPGDSDEYYDGSSACHVVHGWIKGQISCPLWERIRGFCQTENEVRFLHSYLGLVKDRQFPMLLPQVRIGIAERRRPDFVLFVPLQHWTYKWYAIELDRSHTSEMTLADELRDYDLSREGYEVISLGRTSSSYLNETKSLVERIEREMNQVSSDYFSVAKEVTVKSTVVPESVDIPF